MSQPTALYRHFGADGALLYVGVSLSPMSRLEQHMGGAAWARGIATVSVEWLDTREAALERERVAIAEERPRHNVAYAGQSPVEHFCALVGRQPMSRALGVGLTAISNAVVGGLFPAAWYDPLEKLAQEHGVECPRHLFAWRRPDTHEVDMPPAPRKGAA